MVEIENWQTLDDNGILMPWYTRPCLKWLQTLDLNGKQVFEYGVGYSTEWYRSRGAEVHGVDHDEKWAKIARCALERGRYKYLREIDDWGYQDIICIDGEWRDECLEYALKYIRKGGFIIIDNYRQPTVQEFWPKTEILIIGGCNGLIKRDGIKLYREPTHEDWQTLVIHL